MYVQVVQSQTSHCASVDRSIALSLILTRTIQTAHLNPHSSHPHTPLSACNHAVAYYGIEPLSTINQQGNISTHLMIVTHSAASAELALPMVQFMLAVGKVKFRGTSRSENFPRLLTLLVVDFLLIDFFWPNHLTTVLTKALLQMMKVRTCEYMNVYIYACPSGIRSRTHSLPPQTVP